MATVLNGKAKTKQAQGGEAPLRRRRGVARPAVQDPPAQPLRLLRQRSGRPSLALLSRPARVPHFRHRPISATRMQDESSARCSATPRLLHAPQHRSPHLRFHAEASCTRRPASTAKRWPEVTINQITWQVGSLKEVVDGKTLVRRPRRQDQPHRPRHAGFQLAHLPVRSRRPQERAVLRHGADRLAGQLQAEADVRPRLPRDAAAAADVGVRRGRARQGRRRSICCPASATARRCRRSTTSTASCWRGRSRSCATVRCACSCKDMDKESPRSIPT